jgi:3-oxoacyl-[acyl-carrier-protein] synthase-3
MGAEIAAISYYLPEKVLTNEELSNLYGDWSTEKIYKKTGISKRHIAGDQECASDLAEKAAKNLFNEYGIKPETIDFILLATQSPDYFLPTTACILQDRLGIPKNSGALDFNLGCSAYVYGLALAKSLIDGGMANNVLLITSEIYSKHIHPMDKSTRTIFGDGASATLISRNKKENKIGKFIFGTDGSGASHLIVPAGGMKLRSTIETKFEEMDENGAIRSKENIYMNGPEIFSFTISVVPKAVKDILIKSELDMDEIDLFIFHQANKYMLDYLRKKINIPNEKFYINLKETGNTVSSSIPIALKMALNEEKLNKGHNVMLVGFGVGLSWAATIIKW